MTTNSHGHGARTHVAHRFPFWPTTQLGWWAMGLAAVSIVFIPSWKLMGSAGAIPGLLCGLAGGVVALTAMAGRKEQAVTTWLWPGRHTLLSAVVALNRGRPRRGGIHRGVSRGRS